MAGVCAVLVVRDEADIIGSTVRHLLGQVDHVVVVDNLSTDGTGEIAADLGAEVARDSNPAHQQDLKMTTWAHEMRRRGFEWMVPCDADEFWYAYDGATLATRLGGLGPEIEAVIAPVFNHVPTSVDPDEIDPFLRIGWCSRMVSSQWRKKVACRLQEGLRIMMGNHRVVVNDRKPREQLALAIRHFPHRSADQYVRKMVNGNRAIALTDFGPEVCWHWREVADLSESELAERFETVYKVSEPHLDPSLVYDPAPMALDAELHKRELELSPATSALWALEREREASMA